MKTKLCLFFALGLMTLMLEARTWTLIPGGKLEGQLASLATNGQVRIVVGGDEIHQVNMHSVSGNKLQFEGELVLVARKEDQSFRKKRAAARADQVFIQQPNGETLLVTKTNLIAADRDYIAKMEADMPRLLLEQELRSLINRGYVELTRAQIETNSAKMAGSNCWIDGEFVAISPATADRTEPVLLFSVRDKDGAPLERCRVPRDGKKDVQVQKLQRGDKVRLTGVMVIFPTGAIEAGVLKFNTSEAEFAVATVELIAPAEQKQP